MFYIRSKNAFLHQNYSENIQALLKIGKNERRSTVASALKG
jgi:hypothetical protein